MSDDLNDKLEEINSDRIKLTQRNRNDKRNQEDERIKCGPHEMKVSYNCSYSFDSIHIYTHMFIKTVDSLSVSLDQNKDRRIQIYFSYENSDR